MFDSRPYSLDRIFRLGVMVLILWGLVRLLGYLSDVLIPFAVALLLAYVMNPLVTLLRRWVRSHILAVWLALLAILLVLGLITSLVVPLMVSEVRHMGQLLKELVDNSKLAQQAAERMPADLWQYIRDVAARPEVREFFQPEKVMELAREAFQKILPGFLGVLAGTATILSGLMGVFFVLIYLVFLLLDYQKLSEEWKNYLPETWREPVLSFLLEFNQGMNRYFRAQALVASLVGVMMSVGFMLIGLPLGLLLGLLVGVLNMVPYLQLVALVPAFFLSLMHALETGGSFWISLGLTGLVFAVVQIVQDVFLSPRIMGKVMGLSPAVILLSLSIWGKLLGILGLLIALPATCLLLAYYKRFLASAART